MYIRVNDKYKVDIFSQENEGLGVSKIEDVVAFIENGLPGDSGEVLIAEVKKNFVRGKMISFTKKAYSRQVAPCPYYDHCGGCNLQHQQYSAQLKFKENKVKVALERIGGLKDIQVNDIVYSDNFNYRNKVTLKIKGTKLGFYHHNTNDIIDIDNCLISDGEINKAIECMRAFVAEYKNNSFSSLVIRSSDDGVMISLESESNELENELVTFLTNKIVKIKSLILNNKVIYGDDYLIKKIGSYKFKLSALSFYQVNNNVMAKLYNQVERYVAGIKNDTILDLYCGIGTMTMILSGHGRKVIGIEIVSDAIENAIENAKMNDIKNVTFIEGKVEDKISRLLDQRVDTVVMDPPRSGVDKKALDAILQINPQQIIYVSCNPVTLARDLRLLSEKYSVKEVTPFDMFPQTAHVECVVKLLKNN